MSNNFRFLISEKINMILAITERYDKFDNKKYFEERFYLSKYFKDIFEELNVLLFPVSSNTRLETVVNICDGLLVTGRSIDINPKYYSEKAIEAIEYNKILGVQWHPEQMMDVEFFKNYIELYF